MTEYSQRSALTWTGRAAETWAPCWARRRWHSRSQTEAVRAAPSSWDSTDLEEETTTTTWIHADASSSRTSCVLQGVNTTSRNSKFTHTSSTHTGSCVYFGICAEILLWQTRPETLGFNSVFASAIFKAKQRPKNRPFKAHHNIFHVTINNITHVNHKSTVQCKVKWIINWLWESAVWR